MEQTRERSATTVVVGFALVSILALFLFAWARGPAFAGEPCDANAGENGPTLLDGTPHDDPCLAGGNGPDIIKGKGGDDLLVGGRGPDKLRGGPADDVLRGGQGPDIFICGPGKDVVHNNRSTGADVIDESCEKVR
jgi:hypothetical protein